jgi:hypothetical protein
MADATDPMGLQGAGGVGGLLGSLRQMLLDRAAKQMYADKLRQQDFENQLNTRRLDQGDQLHRDQMTLTAQTRADALAEAQRVHDQENADRTFRENATLNEAIPPQTFLPPESPIVGRLQAVGALQPQDERPAVDTGPLLPGDTGAAKLRGFLKLATAKQQADADERQRKIDEANAKQQPKPDVPVMRIGRAGTLEQIGTAPAGSHFATEPAPPSVAPQDNRLDRSYQYHRTALDKLATPLDQQQQKISELNDLLNQGTPQADAIVAPKLLTIIAGGQGSGLRMNEAEISRVVGGRSQWETLKAAAQRWSVDPNSANSITPSQRQQMRSLVSAVQQKGQQAVQTLNDAGDELLNQSDVVGHRQVLANTHKKLQQIFGSGGGSGGATTGGSVHMKAPDGRDLNVPADRVAELEKLGAKRVP